MQKHSINVSFSPANGNGNGNYSKYSTNNQHKYPFRNPCHMLSPWFLFPFPILQLASSSAVRSLKYKIKLPRIRNFASAARDVSLYSTFNQLSMSSGRMKLLSRLRYYRIYIFARNPITYYYHNHYYHWGDYYSI